MQYGKNPRGSMRPWTIGMTALALALGGIAALTGCQSQPPPPHEEPHWPTLPLVAVPDFMHATLFERVRFTNLETTSVYGYSLAVGLHGTGDSTAPSIIRDYITKQILLRGFDSWQHGEYHNFTPEQMYRDPRVAIVSVEGPLPVGAREGQRFDVIVRALPRSHTTSLAHGRVYQTDLSDHGLVNPQAIGAHVFATVEGGEVFVNPAYALKEGKISSQTSQESLRVGTILGGGVVAYDRPINMQLRQPQLSTARLIEELVARRFNAPTLHEVLTGDRSAVVAIPKDEGLVEIFVPRDYRGDWKHFLGVLSHMYLDDSPAFLAAKAKQLVVEAHKPNAPLADISLCWEAMGGDALPIIEPLISDPDSDVAFAAARAAAYCGDSAAREALLQMASDSTDRNQVDAVKTLGGLAPTPEIMHMLRTLLGADRAEVRIAAYTTLISRSPQYLAYDATPEEQAGILDEYGFITKKIGDRFLLDIVPTNGPPMVYATSTGVPRIAIFGHNVGLQTPVTFMAMDSRLSISSSDGTKLLSIFYRDPHLVHPIDALSDNDLVQIVARLGGEGPASDDVFDFTFNDVVAITQQLVDSHNVFGEVVDGQPTACVFELQHPQLETDPWTRIPTDNEAGRPQGNSAPAISPTAGADAGHASADAVATPRAGG
jgi:hypothetical protein